MNKTNIIIGAIDIGLGILELIWGQLLFGIAMIIVGLLMLIMGV